MKINVGSDFSGVGAFNQALKRLKINYNEVFACDKNKHVRKTFLYNYNMPSSYPEDVYQRDIPTDPLTIYVSSPPCQSFSIAGKRLGKKEKRGILFFNTLEFIKKNKPRYFIIENVKGLLSDDNGKTFSEWVNYLAGKSINGLPVLFAYENSVPYHLYHTVLNGKNYGVPQNRERVFIVGIRDDQDNKFTWPKKQYLTNTINDILENNVDEKYFLNEKQLKLIEGQHEKVKRFIADFRNDEGLRIRKDNISPCMAARRHSATDVSTMAPIVKLDNQKIRRLTPRECFRLMNFPESFTWPVNDTEAYKQAGNSIIVNCLYLIIEKFKL